MSYEGNTDRDASVATLMPGVHRTQRYESAFHVTHGPEASLLGMRTVWYGCYGRIMQKLSLDALARKELQAARQASSGRSARMVFGGHEHVLRQTVIALLAGRALGDHENPGEATVHVLRGRVRLHSGNDAWDGRQGDLLLVPAAVHGLEATEDAVVLLTVAKHR
jgi:quercetin dioxygenase-like cupin family protein